jgi:hypothetical protein
MLPFRTAYLLAYRCGYFSQQIAILMPCVLNVLLEKCNLTAPQSNQLPFYGSYTVPHLFQLTQYADQVSADAGTMHGIRAGIKAGENAPERIFVPGHIRGIDFLHQAFAPRTVPFIGRGVWVNSFGGLAVELFQVG